MVNTLGYLQLQQQNQQWNDRQKLAKQQMMMQLGETLAKAGAGIASQYIQGAQQNAAKSKQDGIANSLMDKEDQSIPRAQAVDQNGQTGAAIQQMADDQIPADKPHTGGMDELKLNLAMEQRRRAGLSQQLEADRLNSTNNYRDASLGEREQYHKDLAEAREQARIAALTSQKNKEAVMASTAYFKTAAIAQKQMAAAQAAGDFDAYNKAATDLQGAHYGTKSAGVKDLPDLEIPDFKSPPTDAMKQHIDDWEGARKKALWEGEYNSSDNWNPFSSQTYGKDYMKTSDALYQDQRMQRRPVTKWTPPAQQAAPQQQGAPAPVGMIVVDPTTGKRLRKTFNGWTGI